jgi:cell division septation protein DedD
VLLEYERPADQSEAVKVKRAQYGQGYYDKYASKPVAPQPTPGQLYYVQTGAYSVKANADAQYQKVKAKGFDAIIKQSGNLYRVQVGAFSVRANAESMAAKLKAKGFDTYITTTGGTQVAVGAAPAATPAKTIKVGSKVKVKAGAKTYTGGSLASFVYNTVYDVQQINGDRAVIGLKGKVTAAVRLGDLIIQ